MSNDETAAAKLAAIRTEFERGIPDAYAGGPQGRERVWQRVRPLIEDYSKSHTVSADSPILSADPAQADAAPTTEKAARAKPTTRKATS